VKAGDVSAIRVCKPCVKRSSDGSPVTADDWIGLEALDCSDVVWYRKWFEARHGRAWRAGGE
jgi:hypothetical protein